MNSNFIDQEIIEDNEKIKNIYIEFCNFPSDINEHLPTLYNYAKNCESIIECGVRGVVSSWALLYGFVTNNFKNKKYLLNDIVECEINQLLEYSKNFKKMSIKSILVLLSIFFLSFVQAQKKELNPKLLKYCSSIPSEFNQISQERKADLEEIANYI